ncbi:LOW QUALITY PROTEIN: protein SSX1-like [Megaptera novaeangliae]
MNRGSSFAKSPREYSHKSENSKAFKDISKYFPKKEWADLGYSEKITYVMKRNYDIMTDLGLKATLPTFMRPKKRATKSNGHDSKGRNPGNQRVAQEARKEKKSFEVSTSNIRLRAGSEQAQKQLRSPEKADTSGQQSKKTSGPKGRKINVWTHRLRERKNVVIYEEISDPEEDD